VATIIGKIGLVFAIVTFLVLMGRFIAGKATHSSLTHWSVNDAISILNFFAIAVTIVVVAVPEGLPLAVTLSLAFAMQRLMDEKALVRHLAACETMGSVTCICTDKTGTLTTNHMVVDKLWLCEINKSVQSKDVLNELKEAISDNVFNILHEGIIENSGSEVVRNKNGTHTVMGTPTETALLEFAMDMEKSYQIETKECKKLKVEPFNSDKKKMSTIVSSPNGQARAFCKGASEIVLQMCEKIIDNEGNDTEMTEDKRETISKVIDGYACDALRTLCVAYKDIGLENDNDIRREEIEMPDDGYTFIALFGIKDPVRPGVREAVKTCQDAGIMVRMVTGDNINTAKAIARECGIFTGGLAIEGPEFRSKSPEEMKELIPQIQVSSSPPFMW
jgi:P-type Ca2+ transporter type 2C